MNDLDLVSNSLRVRIFIKIIGSRKCFRVDVDARVCLDFENFMDLI